MRVALAPWRLSHHSLMVAWLEAASADARYTYSGKVLVPC